MPALRPARRRRAWDGAPLVGARPQALLAALVLEPRGLTVAHLVEQVWEDDPPANPGKALQVLVSRAALGHVSRRRRADRHRLPHRPGAGRGRRPGARHPRRRGPRAAALRRRGGGGGARRGGPRPPRGRGRRTDRAARPPACHWPRGRSPPPTTCSGGRSPARAGTRRHCPCSRPPPLGGSTTPGCSVTCCARWPRSAVPPSRWAATRTTGRTWPNASAWTRPRSSSTSTASSSPPTTPSGRA